MNARRKTIASGATVTWDRGGFQPGIIDSGTFVKTVNDDTLAIVRIADGRQVGVIGGTRKLTVA